MEKENKIAEEQEQTVVLCDNCRREKAVGENKENLYLNLCEKCGRIFAQHDKTQSALFKIV